MRFFLHGAKVGWFAPTYKIFLDAWDTLSRTLRPAARKLNEQHKRIEGWNGGVVEGWSMDTDDPGRSRDYDLIVVDEAGLIVNLTKVWRQALRPTLVDRRGMAWFFGTPRVVCPDFNTLFDAARDGVPGYEDWAAHTARTIDNPYIDPEEIEAAKQTMEEWEYLQEYEGVPTDASAAFFSAKEIEAHRARHAHPHLYRCAIDVREDDAARREHLLTQARFERVAMEEDPHGPWRMWMHPEGKRPDQTRVYALAADLGAGVGSSNTVIAVGDAIAKRKIAEFVSARVTPDEAARLAVAAALWFGGKRPPTINFEANGSTGELFCQELVRLRWSAIWRSTIGGARADAQQRTGELYYGWRSSERAKHELLGNYRAALSTDRFRNPSDKALDECRLFRIDKFGRLVNDSRANDPLEDAARVPHGDRVIADAILHLTMQSVAPIEAKEPEIPISAAQRVQARFKALRKPAGGLGW